MPDLASIPNVHREAGEGEREAAEMMERTGARRSHAQRVLDCIRAHPDGLTAPEIAELVKLDHPAAQRRISDLCRLDPPLVEEGTPRRCSTQPWNRRKFATWLPVRVLTEIGEQGRLL